MSSLNDEVAWLLDRLDPRSRETLRGRFSLVRRLTFKELGARFGVSDERMRQVRKQAAKSLEECYSEEPLPGIRAAMLVVQKKRAASFSDVHRLLRELSLDVSRSAVDDFLVVWRAISPESFPRRILWFAEMGLTYRQQTLYKEALTVARASIRQTGAVRVQEVIDALDAPEALPEDVISILSADGMREISPGYWSRRIAQSVPCAVAVKMLGVCGPLNLRELRRGLSRHQRRYPVPTLAVLRSVLKQYAGDFGIRRNDFVHLRNDAGPKLGSSELTWLKLVETYGPVVHADTIQRAFVEDDHHPETGRKLIGNSVLVQEVGRRLFSLPGARITDEDIAGGEEQAIKTNARPALTYDDTGAAIFETTAQEYLLYNGSLSSGPAGVMKGSWVAMVDGIPVGGLIVTGVRVSGLEEARRILDIRMGDRIRIRFDTWTRQASISVVDTHER